MRIQPVQERPSGGTRRFCAASRRVLAGTGLAALLAFSFGCRPAGPVGRLRITPATTRLGYPESKPLRFEWTPTTPLGKRHGDAVVFVHLLNKPGSVQRTFDHPFPGAWSPGQHVAYDIDLYQSALGKPLAPGHYVLSAGLYDPSRGYRWNLEAGGPDVGKREYRVGAVDVPVQGNDSAPTFEFSGDWGPPEPDGSVQVLARRRLMGPSALRFSAPASTTAGGVIRLAVTVGKDAISMETDCGSGGRRLDPGDHWIGLDMPPAGTCEVRFPVPVTADPGRPDSGSGSLDVAAWRPPAR